MESEVMEIPNYLTNGEFFEPALTHRLSPCHYRIKNMKFEMGCPNGENYFSVIYRVKISILFLTESSKSGTIVFIIKSLQFKDGREMFAELKLYERETALYLDILPKMELLLCETIGPRCHYTTEVPVQTIVLEDLKNSGLRQGNRHIGFDGKQCAALLEKLGKFHAASIALVEKDSKIFEKFLLGMFSTQNFCHEESRQIFHGQYKIALRIVEKWPGYEEIAQKMKKLDKSYIDKMIVNFDTPGSFKVLNHGDLYVNNIFFQYDSDNPVNAILIDYQGCFYSSPGIDINYFLNTSVQTDVMQHEREWLLKNYYYKSFRKTLIHCHIENIPTFEAVAREIQDKEFFGLFSAISSAMVMLDKSESDNVSSEKLFDENKNEVVLIKACQSEMYQHKLKYVLRRANSLGPLD